MTEDFEPWYATFVNADGEEIAPDAYDSGTIKVTWDGSGIFTIEQVEASSASASERVEGS